MALGHYPPKSTLEKIKTELVMPDYYIKCVNEDLPDEVLEKKPANEDTVSGKHLGGFLGEIELRRLESVWQDESIDNSPPEALDEEHKALRRMIRDYAEADIKPLFELYDVIQEETAQ